MQNMNKNIEDLKIHESMSISSALKRMDEVGHKLLIIESNEGIFLGLVSIGDIQRAIISNKDLNHPIKHILRMDLIVSKSTDNLEDIKQLMLKFRLEYMPVLSDENRVHTVIFWDDIIKEDIDSHKYPKLNMPVVIMAGGFGTRLKPLTNILPKPLLPYGDSTILENIIQKFVKNGCNDFHLSVNYKADLIQYYFDTLEEKNYNVALFREVKPLGTAGSLGLLKDQLKSTFFVSNCDIIIDQDYSEILKYHKDQNNELTLVASLKQYNIPYGTIESGENGELLGLKEKPELTFMINCGLYILEAHLLNEIPDDTFFHITDLIEKIKERKGKVGVFPISEKSWTDIGEWHLYSKHININ